MAITVTSFGYGHAEPPELDLEIDARAFRNPHHDPRMRQMTGRDWPVRLHVLATPGVQEELSAAAERVLKLRLTSVGFGCVGGRHRSVAMAVELGRRLVELGYDVEVRHRDVERPVIQS